MFTLNIRDIVAVGKSRMKWDSDATANNEAPKKLTLTEELIKETDPVKREAIIDAAITADPVSVKNTVSSLYAN